MSRKENFKTVQVLICQMLVFLFHFKKRSLSIITSDNGLMRLS